MKIFVLVLISSSISLSSYGQNVWGDLQKRRSGLTENPANKPAEGGSGPAVVHQNKNNEVNTVCNQDKNSSLPLEYFSGLFQEAPAQLSIQRDSRNGGVKLTTGGMVDNCSAMIEPTIATKTIQGEKIHAIQFGFKKGDRCETKDDKEVCYYKVVKVVDGKSSSPEVALEPSIAGLEQCLKETGVVTDKGIDENAMVTKKTIASFSGINDTGEVVIESVGNELRKAKPVFGDDWTFIDGCSRYEQATEDGVLVFSAEDEERMRIEREKSKIASCGDYSKIADFIEKYQSYSDDLYPILEKLIVADVKKATAAILKGTQTDDDLKVLSIFDKYVVTPKIAKAVSLYDEIADAQTSESKSKQEELKKVMGELKSYYKDPFVTTALIGKLEASGLFDEAQQMQGLQANVYQHSQLGSKVEGEIITPEVAQELVVEAKAKYAASLPKKIEHYNTTSDQYTEIANSLREDKITRTRNFLFDIGVEEACITQNIQQCIMGYGMTCDKYCKNNGGRYCYGAFVFNSERCAQESRALIDDWKQELAHYNKIDDERAAEYDALAEVKKESETSDDEPGDSKKTTPTRRRQSSQDNSVYSFDYSAGGNPQAQGQGQPTVYPGYNNNMFTQPNMYPDYMYGAGNVGGGSYMGGVNYNSSAVYPFGGSPMGGGGAWGTSPNYFSGSTPWYGAGFNAGGSAGYWGNPTQAYGNYYMGYR